MSVIKMGKSSLDEHVYMNQSERYSNQMHFIYRNKQDPFLPPTTTQSPSMIKYEEVQDEKLSNRQLLAI